MLVAVAVFLFVTLLILAGYAAIAVLPGWAARKRLERRLREVAASGREDGVSVVAPASTGRLTAIERALAGTKAGSGLTRLIAQSGVRMTPGTVVALSLACGVAAALASDLVVRQPFVLVAAGVVGTAAPAAWLLQRRRARFAAFEEQFPEALDLMSRAIRAGHALQTALGMVADELPAPVGPEFRKTFDQQNFGLPVKDALNDLAERVAILDVRFFATAVAIQRETGGNLAEILDNLSYVVRERFKIRRQVRVHTAHGRFTGYVLLALPAALGIGLSYTNPDQMRPLFQEPLGQMMLLAAVVLQTIGFFWIRYVIRIEV
ncbi:MAG: type II secretion system F family protein [Acidobacteria bacterium]|nr:type II secretion system F family protein [Acidobacteriota bacterium]